MTMIDMARLILFPALMTFAACSDLITMTISNRLSLILTGGFFVMALAIGLDLHAVLWHVAAAFAVLVVAFAIFSQGWIGGGDAKLAAASALWVGFDHLFPYVLDASLLGGALTLLIVKFRVEPLPAVLARQDWIQRLHSRDTGIPYGIALAAAALLVYPDTIWMRAGGV